MHLCYYAKHKINLICMNPNGLIKLKEKQKFKLLTVIHKAKRRKNKSSLW